MNTNNNIDGAKNTDTYSSINNKYSIEINNIYAPLTTRFAGREVFLRRGARRPRFQGGWCEGRFGILWHSIRGGNMDVRREK